MSSFQFQIESDVQANELMDVILDFTSYSRFISSVTNTEVQREGPPVWEVIFSLELIRSLQYTLRLEQRGTFELHWQSLEGFFIKNNGCWILEPLEDGTKITYKVEMEMDAYLPTSIRNSLVRHQLPKTVDAFIQEVKMRKMMQRIDLDDN
jgi:ribosome-associated toxin RatA of RatAB toxin-antitoxin module